MDVNKILDELRSEHQQLGEAILSLERLAAGGKRRGRPPAWLQAAQERAPGPGPGRPAGSTAKKGRKKTAKQAGTSSD
ncbi:MAG TPA: hypothetical protein VNH18_25920 [Bryobacteraceae bacterium]|nr:hypothetical protein [Bryobacteraceae bacterium]